MEIKIECECCNHRLLDLAGLLTENINGYDLQKKYDSFNKKLFNGELPQIPLEFSKLILHYNLFQM